MKSFSTWLALRLIVLGTCVTLATGPALAAKAAVKMTRLTGSVELTAEGPVPFTLSGVASHLGNFEAIGEIEFKAGDEDDTLIGEGVVVFQASYGDLLVGNLAWKVGAADDDSRTSDIHFGWADSVEFSDGDVAFSTGRFTDNRPPGLVVIEDSRTVPEENVIILFLKTILRGR